MTTEVLELIAILKQRTKLERGIELKVEVEIVREDSKKPMNKNRKETSLAERRGFSQPFNYHATDQLAAIPREFQIIRGRFLPAPKRMVIL